MTLADRLDRVLPQTQCTRCGYVSCRAYAEALAAGATELNRCPPGGAHTVTLLAALTGRPARALDPACGREAPRRVAEVDEAWCIGCTLCIEACPVDAIIGAAKRMHTVIEPLCTGCELCVAPCPVDCIVMVPAASGPRTPEGWLAERAPAMRARFEARALRRRTSRRDPHRRARPGSTARRRRIAEAVARARARRREDGV